LRELLFPVFPLAEKRNHAKPQRRKGTQRIKTVMTENEIAKEIVGRCLSRPQHQQPIPVIYDNLHLDIGFRDDLIGEEETAAHLPPAA
jgi:hypothetical protein